MIKQRLLTLESEAAVVYEGLHMTVHEEYLERNIHFEADVFLLPK